LTHPGISAKLQPDIKEHRNGGISVSNLPFDGKLVVGLDEMLKFYAHHYLFIGSLLTRLALLGETDGSPDEPSFVVKGDPWDDFIVKLRDSCRAIGMEMSVLAINAIEKKLAQGEVPRTVFARALEELNGRIRDEISLMLIMRIPKEKATYYDKVDAFGIEVEKKFPDASYDIRQAGNAYATGCNTGCVFHLMRAVEFGVRTLGTGLGIQNIEKPWGPLLAEMRNEIAARRANGTMTRDEHDTYSGAIVLLENVKDAWRNPTMHPAAKYDEAEALTVYEAVKQFMANLTAKIP
jgi:hypothetical protein